MTTINQHVNSKNVKADDKDIPARLVEDLTELCKPKLLGSQLTQRHLAVSEVRATFAYLVHDEDNISCRQKLLLMSDEDTG